MYTYVIALTNQKQNKTNSMSFQLKFIMKPKLGSHYQRFMKQTPDYEKENQEERENTNQVSDQTTEKEGETKRNT